MITQQQYDELKAERDALAAHAKMLKDLAKFWINQAKPYQPSEQEYKTWLALGYESKAMTLKPPQCLAEIRAEAVLKFAEDIGVFSREYDDQGYVEVAKWRVKEYAEEVRQGGAE